MSYVTFLGVSLKMYFDHHSSLRWVRDVAAIVDQRQTVSDGRVQVAVLPSFVSLDSVNQIAAQTSLAVGAQDLSWADSGPYTGEVSGRDLAAVGCQYVEVGHAERRQLFCEDDATIAKKVGAAARNGLTPIVCVGEREHVGSETAARTCVEQAVAALAELSQPITELIVAYEPVWAIGADEPAHDGHVRTVCHSLRTRLSTDPRVGDLQVIYGGSSGPNTLTTLGDAVDGLFLGRFAHDPAALHQVIDEAHSLNTRA